MLHFAVCKKHPEIVQYLIESGASKEAMCCGHNAVHVSATISLDSIMGYYRCRILIMLIHKYTLEVQILSC